MDKHSEALRLKTLAEESYTSSNLSAAVKYASRAHRLSPSIDNLSEMLTAFQILSTSATDWYNILQIEPFSHINVIKKQYRKLALTLHPDKNPFAACEEAFKLVAEGFGVLSDKLRRKEYDTKLRIKMQEASTGDDVAPVDLFWTSCLACETRHRFDRKYLGHDLMCPSCSKSFKALEVNGSEDCEEKEDGVRQRSSTKIRARGGEMSSRTENDKVGNKGGILRSKRGSKEVLEVNNTKGISVEGGVIGSRASSRIRARAGGPSSMTENGGLGKNDRSLRSKRGSVKVLEKSKSKRERIGKMLDINDREDISDSEVVIGSWTSARNRARLGGKRSRTENGESVNKGGVMVSKKGVVDGVFDEVSEKSKSERAISEDEEITLAEMQKLEKKGMVMELSSDEDFEISKLKRAKSEGERITLAEMQILAKKAAREEKMRLRVKEKPKEGENPNENGRSRRKIEDKLLREDSSDEDLEIMAVEDSDFYDFDKDRVERSFKKGQVWAFYDDDDGMPRHYGLIDEVYFYPFKVKLSWLELHINSENRLLNWENTGVRVSCGKFKVAKTELIDSVNVFSHYVDAERAAREMYRVYPKKGSVWALFNEIESQNKDKRCYNIVVCLTSYDEVYGLSIAYLEKVEGFRSVFKRREIGCHAVKLLEKSDFWLFSHQIPARNLSVEETVDIYGDCWELDTASLPSELLRIGWRK